MEHEGGVRSTEELAGSAVLDGQVCRDWARDPAKLLQEICVERSQTDCDDPSSDETLHGLLGAENNEGSGSEEESAHVCRDVVDGDDGHGEDVPDHAVLEGEVEEVSGPHNEESGEVSPGQQTVAGQAVRLVPDGEDEPGEQRQVGGEADQHSAPLCQTHQPRQGGVQQVEIAFQM